MDVKKPTIIDRILTRKERSQTRYDPSEEPTPNESSALEKKEAPPPPPPPPHHQPSTPVGLLPAPDEPSTPVGLPPARDEPSTPVGLPPARDEPSESVKDESSSSSVNLATILDSDEKLLFNLKILGSIQKNEKLLIKDDFLSVDDRWVQSIRRWYDGNNRYLICDTIFQGVTSSCKRVNELLDENYRFKHPAIKPTGSYEEKKLQEDHAICRSKIQEFFLSLSQAKQGIENQRETYTDKFSQTKLNLTLDKLNSLVEKLKTLHIAT